MLKHIITNWKTTSAGLTAIVTAGVSLGFSIKNGTATETIWLASLMAVLNGLGLVFAGDASQSGKQVADLAQKTASAVESGDTSVLKRDA